VTLPPLALVSFAIGLAVTPAMIVVARRTGIMDRPGALKSQATPVPYLGGVGVFAGTAAGALLGRPSVLVPLAAALALGVADDRLDLSPALRLVGEVVVGIMVVVTGPVRFDGVVAVVAVVAVTVLLINGVNLMDGLDMLAGGVCAVAAVAFALLLGGPGRQLAVALAAALVAFLLFNRPPARIYLGDGGAYLLGASLAVLSGAAWAPHLPLDVGMAALAVVALPAAELAFAVVRRLRGRTSLLSGDRGHPYDRLVLRGWHRTWASIAYIALEAVLALGAVAAARHAGLGAVIAVDAGAAVVLVALGAATGALSPDHGAAA
jgi:UDP-GlcNAc:undecaprenyl-phosphate GlcNAc-1-phosphate transferase